MTIILGCLGLLGLAALTISHRTREIGIRKVLGASMPQLIAVLSKDFVRLVAVAFLIAVPLSYYAMEQWLTTFTYKIDMPYYIFPLAGALLLIMTILTLSSQTVKAALKNPTEILKND